MSSRIFSVSTFVSETVLLTDNKVEIEYVDDDKPSTKHLLCLRAPTSTAAVAVRTAVGEIRSGCGGAASQFGNPWDSVVVASSVHAVMDSSESLVKIRAHLTSSRLFDRLELDSLLPQKSEALLYIARGLGWRSLQLPLAAGDKSRVALQRERLLQLKRLCGHLMDSLQDDRTSSSAETIISPPQRSRGWASNWSAARQLKLGIIAVALQWIKRETLDLKGMPAVTTSTRSSLGSVVGDDQTSVASNSTKGAEVGCDVAAQHLSSESPLPVPVVFTDTPSPSSAASSPLSSTLRRKVWEGFGTNSKADDTTGAAPSIEQIISFLTSCGVAISDFDLFEMSDMNALAARERSKIESQKFSKYHEVRTWWESNKDGSICAGGREMRLSGMKIQSLAGWNWEGSMNRITSLFLDGNKLKEFSWDWVLLLPLLEVLSLESNRIERISAFLSKDSCRHLVCLKLGGNKLASLNALAETIDQIFHCLIASLILPQSVGARIKEVTMFGNPFVTNMREEGGIGLCDSITAEYTYVSVILASFPSLLVLDGFPLQDANLWWIKVLSEFNSGAAALCHAMHPCQSTRNLALPPLLSWACSPAACSFFSALGGVSAVLPMLHYIHDPLSVFFGLKIIRRITSGTNGSSAAGLISSDLAPLFWAVLKCSAEDFPELQRHQQSSSSRWTPSWTVSIATLAISVLSDATFLAGTSSYHISPSTLLSSFANSVSAPLSDIFCAIAQLLGKGGRVFESMTRSHCPPSGTTDLEEGISKIWGRSVAGEKWVDDVAGVQSLNDGLHASILHPSSNPASSVDFSSSDVGAFFTYSDALASSAYLDRIKRTSSVAANRRSSLLSSQYSGSLIQSVSKLVETSVTDKKDPQSTSREDSKVFAREFSNSVQALVSLQDCGSCIYDCSIALLAVAPECLRSVPRDTRLRARGAILWAWMSDFQAGALRSGIDRYGNEFRIMVELMLNDCEIAGADIVAVGYVSAAAARLALSDLNISHARKDFDRFHMAVSTFFRALFICSQDESSINFLKEAASREGLELPISSSFIDLCFTNQLYDSDKSADVKGELLGHLSACVERGESSISNILMDHVLGSSGKRSTELTALLAISSVIFEKCDSGNRSAAVPHLISWLLRSFARVPFTAVFQNAGSHIDAAKLTISSLCRYALFETTDIDACTLCINLLHTWSSLSVPSGSFELVKFFGEPAPQFSHLCTMLERVSPSLIETLSPAITSFFARFFAVEECSLSNRGLPLLVETLKSASRDGHRYSHSLHESEYMPVISAIMRTASPNNFHIRLAGELCLRWRITAGFHHTQTSIILRRSAEVIESAAATAAQAAASGNTLEAEAAFDTQCHAFSVYARCASSRDMKLFETALETFSRFSGTPNPSLIVMTCVAACFVMDHISDGAASDAAPASFSNSSTILPKLAEFSSSLSREKQFELVVDAIMGLLQACPDGINEGDRSESSIEDTASALMIVRSIAARLALKASKLDMMVMQKLLHGNTLVPFLSGISTSKTGVAQGVASGMGIEVTTVAVINEICARALQSDVAAAIAASLAVSALTDQCLSAGQSDLATQVIASLPRLLEMLAFLPEPCPSLERLAVSCGSMFKNILKVMCNKGRTPSEHLETLWQRTFECISIALCLQPMLESPALVFESARAVQPPAVSSFSAALRDQFLPIAISAVGLSRLIPWKLDDLSQAITCLVITTDSCGVPPPFWWKYAMESATSNLRNNAAAFALQSVCPPCIVTSSALCRALLHVDLADTLASAASGIVAFLHSVTHFIKVLLEVSAVALPALGSWTIEFICLMRHVISLVTNNFEKSQPSKLQIMFINGGGSLCVSDFASSLCEFLRDPRVDTACVGDLMEVLSICCNFSALALSCSSASAIPSNHVLSLISHVWPYACNISSKVQRTALNLIAVAVSCHGHGTLRDVIVSENDVKAIVHVIVQHIESSQLLSSVDVPFAHAKALESPCKVLSLCLRLYPSLSEIVIPQNILAHLCSFGWSWGLNAYSSSIIESISFMVSPSLCSVVASLASLVFSDLSHLINTSPSLQLVVQLLETNASLICDIFSAELSKAASASSFDVLKYANMLLEYASICALCGKGPVSDEVEVAFGFGMGLLFDDVWAQVPPSCQNLIAERYYLHALFLSRHAISQATVSPAAFSDLVRGALCPTDGGSAASLSLALLLCPCAEDEGESFRLQHLKMSECFGEDLMWSLETSPPPSTNSRVLQVSVLFRIGMILGWLPTHQVEWRYRAASYYALMLAGNCTMQHVVLQVISEIVIPLMEVLNPALCVALIGRSRFLREDLPTNYCRSLLLQIGSCLKSNFATSAMLQLLLVNLLAVLNEEKCMNSLVTRTLVLALAATNSLYELNPIEEIPNIAKICISSQRHVLHSLAAAAEKGVFDIEVFQSVQLLCRIGASDILVAEGMLDHVLQAFDTEISDLQLICIIKSIWHAFAPLYAGEAWLRCRVIVFRILVHSSLCNLLNQRDLVISLTEIITHTIKIDKWACQEVMPNVANVINSALHFQCINLIRKFFDALNCCTYHNDASIWCEEFVVVTSCCCGCDDALPENASLRLAACRLIFAISQQNTSTVALASVTSRLVDALDSCSKNSQTMELLIMTMSSIASASPLLLTETFPSALVLKVPLEVIDSLSTEAIICTIQLTTSLVCKSYDLRNQFFRNGGLNLLQHLLKKFLVFMDSSSMQLCILLSQLMLGICLPPEFSDISVSISILLRSWKDKLNLGPLEESPKIESSKVRPESFISRQDTDVSADLQQYVTSLDRKISLMDSAREELRASMTQLPKLIEIKNLLDMHTQHQHEFIQRQQIEISSDREQQHLQLQMQNSLLQHQQQILEEQRRQLAQQQQMLQELVSRNQTGISLLPSAMVMAQSSSGASSAAVHPDVGDFPSAPPLSIDLDDFVKSSDHGTI